MTCLILTSAACACVGMVSLFVSFHEHDLFMALRGIGILLFGLYQLILGIVLSYFEERP